MRIALFLFLVTVSCSAFAQLAIPFDFTSEDENRLIKENDSLKFYVASTDTNNTVIINEEASYYKLRNKERKIIAEGPFLLEGEKYMQDGKWVEHYDNGNIKITGYFYKGLAIGTWEEYYATGKIKSICNYGIFIYKGEPGSCLSGTWQEFHSNGKLKVNGFYSGILSSSKDTITVEDPVSGQSVSKIIAHNEMRARQIGHWEYYSETGELEKAVDF